MTDSGSMTNPSEAMIEVVARAISVPEHHTTWDLLTDTQRDLYRMQADYAVKAVQQAATPATKPSEAMIEMSAGQVRDLIRGEVADWGSQKAAARRIGVSPAYLSDVLLQRREPGPKIAHYFELEAVTVYRVSGRAGNE